MRMHFDQCRPRCVSAKDHVLEDAVPEFYAAGRLLNEIRWLADGRIDHPPSSVSLRCSKEERPFFLDRLIAKQLGTKDHILALVLEAKGRRPSRFRHLAGTDART